MKNLIYLVSLITAVTLSAQPALNVDNLKQIGDQYERYSFDTVGVDAGDAGAGINWDFTDLSVQMSGTSPFTVEVVDPSQASNSSRFPDADMAEKTDTAYTFYQLESNNLIRLGTGFDGGVEVLSDPQYEMKIPTTYQTNWTDAFEGKYEIMGQEMDRSGDISVTADAYGTLQMPMATYNNTLRLKAVFHAEDVLPPPIPGAPSTTVTTDFVSYSWYEAGNPYPLLTITKGQSVTQAGTFSRTTEINNVAGVYEESAPQKNPPVLLAPQDGATDVEIPFTLEWEKQEAGIASKNNKTQQEVEFHVQISTKENFDQLHLDTATSETTLQVSNADHSTTYYWRVREGTGENASDWSDTYSLTTEDGAPAKPVLISPEDGATDVPVSPLLKWHNNDNAGSWKTYLSETSDFDNIISILTMDTSTANKNLSLKYNTTYYWRVMAESNTGNSEWSETWSFTTEAAPEPPAKPVLISPANNSTEVSISPEFTWEDDPDVETWMIKIASDEALNVVVLEEQVTENTYMHTDELDNSTQYYWSVNAYDGEVWSGYSDPFSFTTEEGSGVIYGQNRSVAEVYPNPAGDVLNISLAETIKVRSAKIIDLKGKTVVSVETSDLINGKKVNITELSSGMYFIIFESQDKIVIPFMKK